MRKVNTKLNNLITIHFKVKACRKNAFRSVRILSKAFFLMVISTDYIVIRDTRSDGLVVREQACGDNFAGSTLPTINRTLADSGII